jgi:guanylate kinase
MSRLIILSGPSCAGKSPLHAALNKFYPELGRPIQKLVLFNSRPPRPKEIEGKDYYFRTRREIETFKGNKGYMVMELRGDIHALKIAELDKMLATSDVIFEGNPFMGCALLDAPGLKKIKKLSVFISPLSKEELVYLKDPSKKILLPEFIADIQRRKLLRRMQKQKGILSLKDLEEAERRCQSAYREMQKAHSFEHVLPNHDGEDNDNWDAFYYPVGDAFKTLIALAELLKGKIPDLAEKWEAKLLP